MTSLLNPMLSSLLAAPSGGDDLESMSTEELELVHAAERDRLELTKKASTIGGIASALALGRLLRR